MTDTIKELWLNADAVCFDVDSTVIQEEAIDEVAKFCNKGSEVQKLYEYYLLTINIIYFIFFNSIHIFRKLFFVSGFEAVMFCLCLTCVQQRNLGVFYFQRNTD